MKTIAAMLMGVSLLAGSAAPAAAEPGPRHTRKSMTKHYYYVRPGPQRRIEYDANKLPFGSRIWWEQMVREGRARG